MTRQCRGQITIPDVVYFAAGFVVLAALAPAIYQLLGERSSEFSTGTVMLWQIVVPGLAVTLVVVLFALAVGGK